MKTYIFSLAILFVLLQSCSTTNHLKNSKSSLLELSTENIVKFGFEESYKTLGHNFEPWETTNYAGKGTFWVNQNTFLKQDTIINSRGRKYTSKTNYDKSILLFLDYGDEELLPLTEDLYFEKIINTSRYSPILVLEYFVKNEADTKIEISSTNAIYSLKMGKYAVKVFINKATNLVDKITYLSYDELYGDVTTSFIYSTYVTKDKLTYPNAIQIEKINGKVIENVKILTFKMVPNNIKLLEKPSDYKLIEPIEYSKPEIKVTKYNNYIHFIDLSHTDDKVLVVEIDDYVLVAEAPINSKNGELVIAEVKKIAPNKPIKYFIFGHHHPHYLGGLRAFVNQDATILCTDISKEYVEYIANAPHTLMPDNLQLNPKKVKTQVVKDSLVLGKNKEMIIYFMGEKSAHTKDYLIYYFPNDKMLFQDDLCSIPKEGVVTKAGNRQVGLYNFIEELNLDVDTIIQSWPVINNKVKTIIPFTDLQKSMQI
jgi:glyoxylase-like metal-dependent hydrolase (beta-lactamase superfamily II)